VPRGPIAQLAVVVPLPVPPSLVASPLPPDPELAPLEPELAPLDPELLEPLEPGVPPPLDPLELPELLEPPKPPPLPPPFVPLLLPLVLPPPLPPLPLPPPSSPRSLGPHPLMSNETCVVPPSGSVTVSAPPPDHWHVPPLGHAFPSSAGAQYVSAMNVQSPHARLTPVAVVPPDEPLDELPAPELPLPLPTGPASKAHPFGSSQQVAAMQTSLPPQA
jgi:hypothetical protein